MSLNEEKFFSILKKINCFEKNPHVAVGVSGGPDSMALVFLVNKWIKLRNGKLTAIIFDHRIRDNSKNESFEVRTILKNLNINSVILRAQRNNLTKKKKIAINDLNQGKSWKNGFYQNHIFRLPQKSLYNKHD